MWAFVIWDARTRTLLASRDRLGIKPLCWSVERGALLVESTLSVKEIAGRVGYSTTTQLDRHFKRTMKMLPSEYRSVARAAQRDCDEVVRRVG